MIMTGYFTNFFTNRELFSEQFNAAARNIVEMAGTLQSAINLNTAPEFEAAYLQIDKKENIGDDITHKIHLYLNKIFFTPLNRPDIQSLASGMDDVADGIRETAGRIYLYHIDECSPAIKQIADILLKACMEIEKAIHLLWSVKNTAQLSVVCTRVKNFEQQAGKVYYQALAGLFSEEKNPIRLLKYREILSSLEATVGKCKLISDELNLVMINR
jgi:predicted phosphate transport protein (TIGR00153 family)